MNWEKISDGYRLLCETIQMMQENGISKESAEMEKMLWSAELIRKGCLGEWDKYKQYIRPIYQAFLSYL